MPRLLKNETRQRLHMSVQALRQAFANMAVPKTVGYEHQPGDGALEMGLIGIAAELALSACIVEVSGTDAALRAANGFYLTAGEALEKFKKTLGSNIPKLSALTSGAMDRKTHLKRLHDAARPLAIIFTTRAAALHAGAGQNHAVLHCAGKQVSDFLIALAEGTKWRPYLREVPQIPEPEKERVLIAEEMLNALAKQDDKQKQAATLAGIFIVLPEITRDEPEWLATLGRVQISPKDHDVSILLKTLEAAKVGQIARVGKNVAGALAVRVEPNNPNALPSLATTMRGSFEQPLDRWGAYVGTANAELTKGIFAPPPLRSVWGFFSLGMENVGFAPEELAAGLPGSKVWPIVAGALGYDGTPGPCFFAVRCVAPASAGEMIGSLEKAALLKPRLQKQVAEYKPLLLAVARQKPAPEGVALGDRLRADFVAREQRREDLEQHLRLQATRLPANQRMAYEQLATEISDADSLAPFISSIATRNRDFGELQTRTMRTLLNCCTQNREVESLYCLFTGKEWAGLGTEVRKAVQAIDFAFFGCMPKA